MKRLLAVLVVLLVADLAAAQPNLSYSFVRSREGVPVFGTGLRPTVTAEMGIPPGTPFFDTSANALFYWSGSAWANSGGVGVTVEFEGATVDDSETSITATDPTADRTITLPDASGTAMLSTLATNAPDAANAVTGTSNGLLFEGATGGADAFETTLTVTDPTADRTITLPNSTGTVLLSSTANERDTANAVWANTGSFIFEGSTANDFETELDTVDPTADRTIYLPDASGTVALMAQLDHSIPDSGDGNPAAYTLDPTSGVSVVTLDCADAHGCSVTMGETNAVAGQRVTIIQTAATAGAVTLVHSAGVANLDADSNQVFTGVGDAVTLIYVASVWLQIAPLYDAS